MDRVNNQCKDTGCDSTAQLIEDHIRMTKALKSILESAQYIHRSNLERMCEEALRV